jgi:putative radical SAM enzyme (TIGR03279 family)
VSVVIESVLSDSYAYRVGIQANDELVSINSHEIFDVLDYRFYIQARKLSLLVKRDGDEITFNIRKSDEFSDIGLEFKTYLMDKQHSCKNKCIFCFVDQMPKGMRDTLYFKDDDSRMSFLFGNYITLTGLCEREVQRIIDMHISPVNISVHTMNPTLRVEMMKNPHAGESLDILRRFADAGIEMNTQLVLCPGINDGDELMYSLSELGKLGDCVKSIAAVPVGLTKYRDGLYPLHTYSKEEAESVIDIIDDFNAHYSYYKDGKIIAYPSDEFYILAERPMPTAEYYGEFSQLDNGVGMCALLEKEFTDALADEDARDINRTVTVATGCAAYPLISRLCKLAEDKFNGLNINVIKINNEFFGETVTVAGLITGRDYIAQLKDISLGDELLIPLVSLRNEGDRFLDDITIEELSDALNINVCTVRNDGYEFLDKIINGGV